MQWRQPPMPPGQRPPQPGGWDPPPFDCCNNGECHGGGSNGREYGDYDVVNARNPRHHGSLGERTGRAAMATDKNNANAEAGKYVHNFLEVALCQLCEGHFGKTTTTKETSKDNEHDKDIVVQLMFKTLCKGVRQEMHYGHRSRRRCWKTRLAPWGCCCCHHPTAHPKHRLSAMTTARAGRVDLLWTKQLQTGQG